MTWYELSLWFDGHGIKERNALEANAHFTACLMNCWTKRRIRGSQLIGTRKGVVDVTALPPNMPPDLVDKIVKKTRKQTEE